MASYLSFMVALVLLCTVHGHVFKFGDCPSVDVMKDFEMKKFTGAWYVVQKFRTSSNCVRENITSEGDSYYITEQLEPIGVQLSQKGKVSFVPNEPSSVMKVDFPYSTPLGDQNYWVIMTDYEQYAAVWSCQRLLGIGHRESAQIMSRTPTLNRDVIQKIRKRFETFGINEHYFSVVDQAKCGYEKLENRNEKLRFKLGPIQVSA
ncbi:Apolipoprotein D [Halotydeus destructor]|nr:Apolipoprotein D [Halotydeus destructor]